ncbi:hypothetical protein [Blastopirellula marina]|uniref:PepSY domain-containing protein n=1 Tax=Blastopirellula marina TaxID=124 RepID=A0A2S8F6P8_9BACT|nr:hypothetical protein [Blastopirellula marina]PQO27837.1 hypothetical protein C5Y98_26265 [Blastopirellula marina]PTL41572.1 hypothetical protein C5Y97_26280 [Blastopirellula marina]
MTRNLGFAVLLFTVWGQISLADEALPKLDLAECPERVQETIQRELHDLKIPQVEQIAGKDSITYRVVYKMDEMWYETKVLENGELQSKLLEKKLRNKDWGGTAEVYWIEVTYDQQPYDLCVSVDGKLLSKRRRAKPEEEEAPAEEAGPGEIALPQRMPDAIREVVQRESRGGEVTGVPLLAEDNPRVPHARFRFEWSSGTKEGTKINFKIDRTPAVK